MATIVLLDNVNGSGSAPSEVTELVDGDLVSVNGISGDTVLLEIRAHKDDTWSTAYTFSADGKQVVSQAGEYRVRVSSYSSGDICAYATVSK